MLRLGIAVLGFILLVEGWPSSKEHGLLIERLRRSPHYCGPEYEERGPPPPPAQPIALYPPPPFSPDHHHHHHRHHEFEYQPTFDQLKDYSNNSPTCDTCKGKGTNTAISNAESETGNAVAIAISRSKPI